MNFFTHVNIKNIKSASLNSRFIMLGSCFAQNMGEKLSYFRLNSIINPFGILYNPASIANALDRIIDNKQFSAEDITKSRDLFVSFAHHGRFSSSSLLQTLENINNEFSLAAENIASTDFFIITFGSSHIYELKENNKIVANCHKIPAKHFSERRMSISEITETYNKIIRKITLINPNAQFIFSVSPVRYLGYGHNYSQCIKASLLLACEEICNQNPNATYFPAYEIMMDELRDYRFYNPDMIHPSETAINHIWNKFAEFLFDNETIKSFNEIDKINKALLHKPLHPDTPEYLKFIQNTQNKLNSLKEKYPNLRGLLFNL